MHFARRMLVYLVCLKFVVNETCEKSILKTFTLLSTLLNNNTGLRFSREAQRNCSILYAPINKKIHELCVWKEKFSDYGIASDETKVYLLNGSQKPREFILHDLDIQVVYGYIWSFPQSSLIAGYIQNGRFTGAVHIGPETYYIEPVYMFSSIMKMKISNREMSVMYRAKDINFDEGSFNDTLLNMSPAFILHYRLAGHHQTPVRTPTARLCSMSITADYTLYNELHSKSVEDTVTHLLLITSEVNLLMRNAKINNSKQSGNIGIKIERIIIESTSNSSLSQNFSRFDELLDDFSKGFHFGVCLSSLFTFRNFGDKVLGQSWIGSSSIYNFGGMCEKPRAFKLMSNDTLGMTTLNTFVVCLKYSICGDAVPFPASVHITAHEIGHSFGSPHDNPTDTDKAHIMNSFCLSGGYTNHLLFSEESLQSMSEVVRIKGTCLEESKDNYCGNDLIEEGEECDCGIPSECLTRDPCCIPRGSGRLSCRVRRSAGYKCHPSQGLCCLSNCQYRDLTKFQLVSREFRGAVKEKKITCPCKDNDLNCSCGLLGRCIDDQCHSLECTRLELQECICSPSTDKYCVTCCISSDQKCVPATILTAELLKSGNITLGTLSNYEKNDNWTHSSVLVKQYCVGEKCLNITFRKWKRKDVCVAFGKLGFCSSDSECVHYVNPDLIYESGGESRIYDLPYTVIVFIILFNLLCNMI